MARIVLWALVALVVFSAPTMAQTIESATAKWPICNLGAKPIAPGPEPAEALVFRTDGGPVIMSQKGGKGAEWPLCRMAPGARVYRGTDGVLRDLPSNQPFFPVGWDAAPPPAPGEGKPGPAPTEAQLRAAVAAYCAANGNCRGEPGESVDMATLLAAIRAQPAPTINFPSREAFEVRGWGCSVTCRWVVGSVVVVGTALGVSAHNNWWRSRAAPPLETGRPPGEGGPGPVFVIFGVPVTIGR